LKKIWGSTPKKKEKEGIFGRICGKNKLSFECVLVKAGAHTQKLKDRVGKGGGVN